ncbi:MAG: myo-inosose-2 dehydratase [Negativicutes bacterium]|nr:myo-inosose-2 dehydratase [Negativicutes bacterium]
MFDREKVRLGIAPIAWTNDDMPELGGENTFEQCVSEMALAGFSGCEVGSKFPRDVAVLKKALSLRKLSVASAWFSSFLTTDSYERTAAAFVSHRDFLRAMGARVVVVSEQGHSVQGQMNTPVFDGKPHFSDQEWQRLTDGLENLGRLAKEVGMTLVYHHHMGTGVQTAAEIDRLMAATDPEQVSLLFDSGHLTFAGENPLAVLEKHVSRVRHVHLKDIRSEVLTRVHQDRMSFLQAVKAGVFTVPGDGMIDFRPLFKVLDEHGYQGWLLVEAEQDPALANPLEYALKARSYIRETTGL